MVEWGKTSFGAKGLFHINPVLFSFWCQELLPILILGPLMLNAGIVYIQVLGNFYHSDRDSHSGTILLVYTC